MLYASPTASVLTNSERSHPFSLFCGCRQDCPLSPLLFAICIEPLATGIRNHPEIVPIHLEKMNHQLILFLSQADDSVPPLLDLIEKFGRLSGYTINWQKLEFMPLGEGLNSNGAFRPNTTDANTIA